MFNKEKNLAKDVCVCMCVTEKEREREGKRQNLMEEEWV